MYRYRLPARELNPLLPSPYLDVPGSDSHDAASPMSCRQAQALPPGVRPTGQPLHALSHQPLEVLHPAPAVRSNQWDTLQPAPCTQGILVPRLLVPYHSLLSDYSAFLAPPMLTDAVLLCLLPMRWLGVCSDWVTFVLWGFVSALIGGLFGILFWQQVNTPTHHHHLLALMLHSRPPAPSPSHLHYLTAALLPSARLSMTPECLQAAANWRNLLGLLFSVVVANLFTAALATMVRFPLDWVSGAGRDWQRLLVL